MSQPRKSLSRLEQLKADRQRKAREENARFEARVNATALRLLAASNPEYFDKLMDKATADVEKTQAEAVAKSKATRAAKASPAVVADDRASSDTDQGCYVDDNGGY